MCGITGFTHCYNELPAGVFNNALKSIAHRGPDQQAGHTSQFASLGTARLRIVDLENGDQPIHSIDRRFTIVFNGEVYNHNELRTRLIARGHTFRTRTDTEVVLNAWLEWGNDAFHRLRGIFAAAIWSEQDRRLILVRDRMGVKPLYYLLHNRDIFFGSELKTILAHPAVPRKIDLDGLNCYLGLNYVPGSHTLVQGITKLRPGHLLEWRQGDMAILPWLQPARETHAPATLDEAAEELDPLLHQAVAEQLPAEVEAGIWLSGGMDSSTIAHYAAQHSAEPLRTFSITFNGQPFDESGYIRSISEHYGTRHTDFDLNENSGLAETILDMAYHSDEPGADAGAIPVWYLARITKPSATVALCGEGADELFGGYLTYQANRYHRVAAQLPASLLNSARRAANLLPASDEKIGFDYKLKRFLEGATLSPAEAHVFWNGTFNRQQLRSLFRFANQHTLANLLAPFQQGNSLERFLEFDCAYSLPDSLLYKVDRMSMAHAVEARPPFLDDRIVDFACRLPFRFKINGSANKIVLRALMKNKLPQAVLSHPKIGLDVPIHKWFRGSLEPLLYDYLNQDSIHQTGLFNWPVLAKMLDEHKNRKANWGYHLWGILTLMLWIKTWKIETPEDLSWPAPSLCKSTSADYPSYWPPLSSSAPTP